LIEELKRATGLGGRPRRSGSPAEKARVNVTRTIRHAIRELASRVPDLAVHLEESIVTGVSCCYEPRRDIVWTTGRDEVVRSERTTRASERTPSL